MLYKSNNYNKKTIYEWTNDECFFVSVDVVHNNETEKKNQTHKNRKAKKYITATPIVTQNLWMSGCMYAWVSIRISIAYGHKKKYANHIMCIFKFTAESDKKKNK